MAWHDEMIKLIGPSVDQDALNNLVVIEDGFDMFKAAVKATHSLDGPTLAQWIQTMALGDGRHKRPIKAALQRSIAKKPGDRVTVVLHERLERGGD